jgi:hypothetical protein
MNPWDLFTHIMAVILGFGSLAIFVAFLFDLKDVLKISR